MVTSSWLNFGSISDLRFDIVVPGWSGKAARKRFSGSGPGIESVNPSVNTRTESPGRTMAVRDSYSASGKSPSVTPGASRNVADAEQNPIGELCQAYTK